jgi:hypothetical protein
LEGPRKAKQFEKSEKNKAKKMREKQKWWLLERKQNRLAKEVKIKK